jgi:hypothetical protein
MHIKRNKIPKINKKQKTEIKPEKVFMQKLKKGVLRIYTTVYD